MNEIATQPSISPTEQVRPISLATSGNLGKVSVLEVLATETDAISPNRSNASTRAGGADMEDQ